MTTAQTRDALREALARAMQNENSEGVSWDGLWDHHRSHWRCVADTILNGPLAQILSDLTEARALAQRSGEERDRARDFNRDLHRRVQKAESFRARHGNTYGVKARWRDRQRRRKAEAERDEAVKDMEAAEAHAYGLDEKIASLSPHGTCACSYDRPGDVCMHHSPALLAAIEDRDRAVAVIKGLMSDFLPSDPGDWYAPPGEASVAAAARFLADRELALRAARSVIEPTEGENAR